MDNRATSDGEIANTSENKPVPQNLKGTKPQTPAAPGAATTTGRRPRRRKGQGRTAEVEGIS